MWDYIFLESRFIVSNVTVHGVEALLIKLGIFTCLYEWRPLSGMFHHFHTVIQRFHSLLVVRDRALNPRPSGTSASRDS